MILITFLFFINIWIKIIFKLFFFKQIVLKILLLITSILLTAKLYYYPKQQRLRLSSLRKIRQFFPYQYKVPTFLNELNSLLINLSYFLLFILGVIFLRFYNTDREVDLRKVTQKLYSIFVESDWVNTLLNISLIVMMFILYYVGFPYIKKYFKFHLLRIHYLYYGNEGSLRYSFYNALCNNSSYSTTMFYNKLVTVSNYVLYYLRFKKASYKIVKLNYSKMSFNIITWEKETPLESLVHGYLNTYEHKLHIHILTLVFLSDLFNDGILKNIYIIMPYIFLYELWVRYSKMISFKNRMYDVVLHYFIHKPFLEVDDTFITFGNHTFEKTYLQHIISNYVRNDFVDKEIINHWKTTNREYNPVKMVEKMLGWVPLHFVIPFLFSSFFIDKFLDTV